jgi:hypothetical protein
LAARAGALDVHLSPVDVAELVAAALEELGPVATTWKCGSQMTCRM